MKTLVLPIIILANLIAFVAKAGTADPSGMPVNAATQWLESIAPNGHYRIASGISSNQKACIFLVSVQTDSQAARISIYLAENAALTVFENGGFAANSANGDSILLNYSDSALPEVGEPQYDLENFVKNASGISYDLQLRTPSHATGASKAVHVFSTNGQVKIREVRNDDSVTEISCVFPGAGHL